MIEPTDTLFTGHSTPTEDNPCAVTFVYQGRRWEGGKFVYLYASVDDPSIVQRYCVPLNAQSKRSNDAIGGLYKIQLFLDEHGTHCSKGRAEYLGQTTDYSNELEWEALDSIACGQRLDHIKHKAARDMDALGDLLAPIREIWLRTNAAGRRALLARIIERVTYR